MVNPRHIVPTESNPNKNENFGVERRRIDLSVGSFVKSKGAIYRIEQVLDFESLIGVETLSGRSAALRITELQPLNHDQSAPAASSFDLDAIADERWQIAEQRYAAIKPLIDNPFGGRAQANARAQELGIDAATLYRWVKRYRAFDTVAALVPNKRGWKDGNSRLSPQADSIIKAVIDEFYLSKQRYSAKKATDEVMRRCSIQKLDPPSATSVRLRLSRIPERSQLRGRGHKELAKNRFAAVPGSFPNVTYPLDVVQIDHTPADIILVDDVHRKPIGRPWITLAIDIYSRVVTGYFVSFDPPSETSVAMCVAHSILPKDEWLLMHGVDAAWPVWGVPNTIHTDNGADFRSDSFGKSCLNYGINLEFRPGGQPNYGGHIERILGTLAREIHSLPGTTFSSVAHKDGYNSEKHAALTKSEFEKWLAHLICKLYHNKIHTSLGMTPLKKWEIGIFGNAEVIGKGVAPMPSNRITVLLDFLPSFRRTVQRFGVTIDGLTYYADCLRHWINAPDLNRPDKNREFTFRRDPRDISLLWFFDPDSKEYFRIPFANQALPSVSIWEYQSAREVLRKEGRSTFNEAQLLNTLTDMRAIVEKAAVQTKSARRLAQRRKENSKQINPGALPVQATSSTATLLDSAAGSATQLAAGLILNADDFDQEIA